MAASKNISESAHGVQNEPKCTNELPPIPVMPLTKRAWSALRLPVNVPRRISSGAPSLRALLSRLCSANPRGLGPWNFTNVRHAGSGQFGSVSLANVRRGAPLPCATGDRVALKELHAPRGAKEHEMLFRIEAEAQRRASAHPHVATLYAQFETTRSHYLVLEAVGGGSVRNAMHLAPSCRIKASAAAAKGGKVGGVLSEEIAVAIAAQTARALVFMHAAGVAHRDIKPDNLMLRRMVLPMSTAQDVDVRVVDFGLASVFNLKKYGEKAAFSKTQCGTPGYMAPELYGSDAFDKRAADVYALGVTLFRMLAGYRPFKIRHNNDAAILEHVWDMTEGPTFHEAEWAHIGAQTRQIVATMLDGDASERPSASEVAYRLGVVQEDLEKNVTKT